MKQWRRSGGLGPAAPARVLLVAGVDPLPTTVLRWRFDRAVLRTGNCPELEAYAGGAIEDYIPGGATTQASPTEVDVTYAELIDEGAGWRVLSQPQGIADRVALPQGGLVL